jgi:uncharacterized protein
VAGKDDTMRKIKLTDAEKLILANQFEILAALQPEQRNEHHRVATGLREGDESIYGPHLQLADTTRDEDTALEMVMTILGLYDDLKFSYSQLEDPTGIDLTRLSFPGFHEIEEADLLAFADAQRGKFPAVIHRSGNSAKAPMSEKYSAMIRKWNDLGNPRSPFQRETLIKILEAS